jgi:hypothetical protein
MINGIGLRHSFQRTCAAKRGNDERENHNSRRRRQSGQEFHGEGASGNRVCSLSASLDGLIVRYATRGYDRTSGGVVFETTEHDGEPSAVIKTGPVMERAMRGMRHAIAAMARQGNDLIVDDVMLGRGEVEEYRELLRPFELRFVGLFAPFDVLKARAGTRGPIDWLGAMAVRWRPYRV